MEVSKRKLTRRWRRRSLIATAASFAISAVALSSLQFIMIARGAIITNGPEDKFFCGWNWDDEDCPTRQHCPSGRSEECDGFEEGQKCFANTACDTKFGHGDWYTGLSLNSTSGQKPRPPKPSPGGTARPVYEGKSDDPTDHYFCGVSIDDAGNKCATNCPSGQSTQCPFGEICFFDVLACDARNIFPPTLWPTGEPPTRSPFSGPTKIPTEMPIPPPEPFDYPSDDPSDHWFCGESIDNANSECRVHCPTAKECPMGMICFFGTRCDARTHTPTPPPTRRPTTVSPTGWPTESNRPSLEPSEQIPTRSPTQSPTKRPTYAPMPSLQTSFFCGIDWNDAITNCKKRCPTGEDPECPSGESCFSLTPCTEEMGYPDAEDGDNVNVTGTEGDSAGEPDACVPFEVTITADHWPKETSWTVEDLKTGDVLAEGGNDALVPGEEASYPVECINNKFGCYVFTIKDTGGDGICCEHGDGSYTVKYDNEVIKTGSSFYDDEQTDFGLCGESLTPTASPKNSESSSASGGTAYRCVPKPLVQGGYTISVDKCKNFVNCYNPHDSVGDDWFCDADAECVEAPNCDGVEEDTESSAAGGSYRCVADELADAGMYVVSKEKCDFFDPCYNTFIHEGDNFFCSQGFSCIEAPDCGEDKETITTELTPNRPTASKVPQPPPSSTATSSTEPATTASPSTKAVVSSGDRPIVTRPPRPAILATPSATQLTSSTPTQLTSSTPTFAPTTYRPTLGACGGAACNERDHCRSQYGFCGPGDTYCNDQAIWSKDCPDLEESPPSNSTASSLLVISATEQPLSPSISTASSLPAISATVQPSTQKPIWSKPSGGEKPKPSLAEEPGSFSPTTESSKNPTSEPQTTTPTALPLSAVDNFPSNYPLNLNTPSPSEEISLPTAPTITITDTSTNSSSSSQANETLTKEYECTGDPCPVEIHCRSRYGSCGPGFIYCNTQSVWTADCPPIIPGVTPTRTPTKKPTKSPSSVDVPTPAPASLGGIPNLVLDKVKPTLPPLPKPTLSVVSVGNPLTPSFFGSAFTETDESDEEQNEKEKDKNVTTESNPYINADLNNKLESNEYLDTWLTLREENGARTNNFLYIDWSKIMYGVAFYFLI